MPASPAESPAHASPSGTVLTVAPTGSHAKADVPALPVGSEEVAAAVAACGRVGASVVDLEPRHDTSVPDVVGAVRDRTDLVVRVAAYARSETLRTLLDSGAQVLTCPVNAPPEFVSDLREGARQRGIAVHYEVRDPAELPRLRELCEQDGFPPHVVLMCGAGLPATLGALAEAVAGLPPRAGFTVAGAEGSAVPALLGSLAAGGHVRVGMADTLEYSSGVPVRDNAQLVARAAGVAKIAQRPPLSPDHVRGVFGLSG